MDKDANSHLQAGQSVGLQEITPVRQDHSPIGVVSPVDTKIARIASHRPASKWELLPLVALGTAFGLFVSFHALEVRTYPSTLIPRLLGLESLGTGEYQLVAFGKILMYETNRAADDLDGAKCNARIQRLKWSIVLGSMLGGGFTGFVIGTALNRISRWHRQRIGKLWAGGPHGREWL